MNTARIGQKYLFNVLLSVSMLGASILACSFTDTTPKPSHYGVFFEQNGELIELQEQEIFNIPVEEQMGNAQTISDAQPTIIIWRSDTNLDYLEFLKLNQYLGQSKNSVSYDASPKDDGIMEITPKSTLENGVYCLIQGDPLAVFLSGWCFKINAISQNQQLERTPTVMASIQLPFGEATIIDASTDYYSSGYKLSSNSVVSWDSGQADLLVSKQNSNSQIWFFMQYEAEPFNDPIVDQNARSGIIQMPQLQLDDILECPESGYQYHWVEASANKVYCIRTRDGSHYAIIQVNSVNDNSLSFTWKYQPDGSRRFQ